MAQAARGGADVHRLCFLQELQVLLEVFIDGCFEALKRLLLFVLAPWRIFRRAPPGPSSAAAPGVGPGSGTRVLGRVWGRGKGAARASAAPGAGIPTTAAGSPMGSTGLIDARTCEDIVKQAG